MLVVCPDCATIQEMPNPPRSGKILCRCCERVLERTIGRSLDGALACAIATFLLLVPANLLPFLTVHVAGVAITTRLASGCATISTQGWWLVALFCAAMEQPDALAHEVRECFRSLRRGGNVSISSPE